MVAYLKKKGAKLSSNCWQLPTDSVYIHKDKSGNKNLHFAQSVVRKFRVVATTHKTLVGPV